MSARELSEKQKQEHFWAVCSGDFPILKEFLAEKEKPVWVVFQLLDAFLRGFGQVVFANNPISGLLIVIAFAATSPGTLLFSSSTAFLGLLLSMLTQDSRENIDNGLTVYNPLLVGAASFALIPKFYGVFDSFSLLLLLLGTIISVYLARALGSGKFPCTVWPFNLVEFALLFALATENNSARLGAAALPGTVATNNATSDGTTEAISFLDGNATDLYIDWGMVFRGVVTSASQVFAIDSAAAGAVIYLAIIIYSPATAGFCFAGALIGAFAGLVLGVPLEEVYSGFWGFNSLLTGASLGGNLLVLNAQTSAATFVAIVYTVVLQYAVRGLFEKIDLPILTVPFVVVVSLFLNLRESSRDAIFPRPTSASFPEKQRCDYLGRKRALSCAQIDDTEELRTVVAEENKPLTH